MGGGCLLLGFGSASRPAGVHTPLLRQPLLSRHPPETATVADGRHPTGMHSCLFMNRFLPANVERLNFSRNTNRGFCNQK